MGNKSKKKNKAKKVAPVSNSNPPRFKAPALTEEQKKIATQRLVSLFKNISAKPEPILDMLFRLEIPWRRTVLKDTDGSDVEYIIIKATDLEEGEIRHQNGGSLVNRLYGNKNDNTVSDPVSVDNNNDGSNGDSAVFTEPATNEPAPQANSEEDEYEETLRGIQG